MRTACWLAGLFASRLHQSVGSFARSVGPRTYVFAPSAGPKKACLQAHVFLFAGRYS